MLFVDNPGYVRCPMIFVKLQDILHIHINQITVILLQKIVHVNPYNSDRVLHFDNNINPALVGLEGGTDLTSYPIVKV